MTTKTKIYSYKEINYKINKVIYSRNSNIVFNLLPFGKDFYQSNEDYIQLFLDIQKEAKISALPRELWEYILELKYNCYNQEDLSILLMFDKMITTELDSSVVNRLYTLTLYDFSSELISHNTNLSEYKLELGIIQMDMGYFLKCCYDKIYKKFFFRLCGGDYYNYIANEEASKTLNKLNNYKKYLYSYNEFLQILEKHYIGCCIHCDKPYNLKKHVLQFNM